MLPHDSDLWSVHWLALPEEPSDQRSPSARQASCDSFEPTRRAPEANRFSTGRAQNGLQANASG